MTRKRDNEREGGNDEEREGGEMTESERGDSHATLHS